MFGWLKVRLLLAKRKNRPTESAGDVVGRLLTVLKVTVQPVVSARRRSSKTRAGETRKLPASGRIETMGKVAISLKVTPEGPEVDLEDLEGKISEKLPVEDSGEEEIGFGLTALKVLVVRDEEEGGTDDLENYISDLEGVTSVEVEGVSLV